MIKGVLLAAECVFVFVCVWGSRDVCLLHCKCVFVKDET